MRNATLSVVDDKPDSTLPREADDPSTKEILAFKLNALIEQRGLNQREAADITGMTQPKVSQVRHYKLHNISLERLMQARVVFLAGLTTISTCWPRDTSACMRRSREMFWSL